MSNIGVEIGGTTEKHQKAPLFGWTIRRFLTQVIDQPPGECFKIQGMRNIGIELGDTTEKDQEAPLKRLDYWEGLHRSSISHPEGL